MWHASVSLNRRQGQRIDDERYLDRVAVDVLAGVGGDLEWWQYDPAGSRVGHLRVPVTDVEATVIPPGCATIDAGPEGIRRTRTR